MFLFDRAYAWSDDFDEYVEATSTGSWLGQSSTGRVTFVSPGGATFASEDAPLTLEVLAGPPQIEEDAESIGEFDLLLPSGELVMEESGGEGGETVLTVPPGDWRARWSGFGETAAEEIDFGDRPAGGHRPDRYLLQLWPRVAPSDVVILRPP